MYIDRDTGGHFKTDVFFCLTKLINFVATGKKNCRRFFYFTLYKVVPTKTEFIDVYTLFHKVHPPIRVLDDNANEIRIIST